MRACMCKLMWPHVYRDLHPCAQECMRVQGVHTDFSACDTHVKHVLHMCGVEILANLYRIHNIWSAWF